MSYVSHAGETRNSRKPSSRKSEAVSFLPDEPKLSHGGTLVKRRRPNWSVSLCNAVAGLAGIGQEVHHG